jgi:hypothetical protein
MKNWSRVPNGRLTPKRTSRLIIGRNMTSTSIQTVYRKLRVLSRGVPQDFTFPCCVTGSNFVATPAAFLSLTPPPTSVGDAWRGGGGC